MLNKLRSKIERRVLVIRYWLLHKLIGKMPVVANITISNYDYDNNFVPLPHGAKYMFFNNNVYLLENRIKETVYCDKEGRVERYGNTFVLKEI